MDKVLILTSANWEEEVVRSDLLTLVDFWHDRCPWCIKLNPILDEMGEEYGARIKFSKLNVLENPENKQIAFRYGVMGTPTLLLFCAGRPIDTMVGFQPKDRLKKRLDDILQTHKECIRQSTELKS